LKRMDYTAGLIGGRWTITPLSVRAKERTLKSVSFPTVAEAKVFLKTAQSEGFRFSGADLIDPAQRLVRNRYFHIGDNGELTPSGQDRGPEDTAWEVGDVMPGQERNTGTEAIVERIVKGEDAHRLGCDIAFILRVRNIARMN
jgi:hypothetical protein